MKLCGKYWNYENSQYRLIDTICMGLEQAESEALVGQFAVLQKYVRERNLAATDTGIAKLNELRIQ
ncbi:unnamed protein product [Protopolystoma xenopodis]|uniref:Uncharacterized protein n=1 Tax=Protopolystoma xenopodis TaxID=117903 RepID=A0A3S5A3M0_9PLAT|nr:unnamed protein product [Protopolystoma xenopodis]